MSKPKAADKATGDETQEDPSAPPTPPAKPPEAPQATPETVPALSAEERRKKRAEERRVPLYEIQKGHSFFTRVGTREAGESVKASDLACDDKELQEHLQAGRLKEVIVAPTEDETPK